MEWAVDLGAELRFLRPGLKGAWIVMHSSLSSSRVQGSGFRLWSLGDLDRYALELILIQGSGSRAQAFGFGGPGLRCP